MVPTEGGQIEKGMIGPKNILLDLPSLCSTVRFGKATPRGGPTPPPRRAQPLLLLSRSNPPH